MFRLVRLDGGTLAICRWRNLGESVLDDAVLSSLVWFNASEEVVVDAELFTDTSAVRGDTDRWGG